MGLKVGNEYLVWVATPGGTPSYLLFGGQQDGDLDLSRGSIDGSHKTSGGTALKVPGLREIKLALTFVADLPDAGYTLVESAFNAAVASPLLVQVRKGGAGGTVPVFACSMHIMAFQVKFGLNGTVSGSISFEPEAAPSISLVLS